MRPIARQYRHTRSIANVVWARNHTVNAAMKAAKNVTTPHAAFDSRDPSSTPVAVVNMAVKTVSPITELGIGPNTLDCHDVRTFPQAKVPLMSQMNVALGSPASAIRSTIWVTVAATPTTDATTMATSQRVREASTMPEPSRMDAVTTNRLDRMRGSGQAAGMGWQFTDEVERYAAAALHLLSADPAVHTIGLTVVENARHRTTPLPEPETFGWWTAPDGQVAGAVSVTPPWPLLLEVAPEEALRPLVTTLGPRLTGANGLLGPVTQLASLWAAETGGHPQLAMASRLFRLETLLPPEPGPPGRARSATEDDVPLLVSWTRAFNAETPGPEPAEPLAAAVRERVGWDGYRLWCTDDGAPVSMAGITRPAAGSVRIGPVFTPPERRGRGFAAAATAAAGAAALGRADVVVLFTDLANPTSNALYPRIGFRPVADRATFRFVPIREVAPG